MGKYVTLGATLQCSFGAAPSVLMVIDPLRPMVENKLMATIMDFAPLTNILPFGMCQSANNPTVMSATSAAMGVLTPMPCVPAITAPWNPAAKRMVNGIPAILDNSKLVCMWGGNIEIKDCGNKTVEGE